MSGNITKIGVLTQGSQVASTRFRLAQHLPLFSQNELECKLLNSKYGAYPENNNKFLRSRWLLMTLLDSYSRVLEVNKFDLCILQRELIATLPTLEPLIKIPYIFDVDDAIFLADRLHASKKISRASALTICGNEFLADYFSQYSDVTIIPTSVNTDYFRPNLISKDKKLIIGWSGSSGGLKYLYAIEDSLKKILNIHRDVFLMIISDSPPCFKSLPSDRVIYKKWSLLSEVEDLQNFSIGLMPLWNNDWERGKCSFKMLTYMAIGIPAVVSPVGMNLQIIKEGSCGLLANSSEEWVDGISDLILNPNLSKTMGLIGREIVLKKYSSSIVGRQYIDAIRSTI